MLKKLQLFFKALASMREFNAVDFLKKEVVFYAEDTQSMRYFKSIIDACIMQHDLHVCYLSSDPSDPILISHHERILPFYIGEGWIRTLLFMIMKAKFVVMTMPDLNTYQIKRSSVFPVQYVYVFHALVSTHSNYRKGAFDHFDHVFCTSPYQMQEIRATEQHYQLKPKKLYAMGYPFLDDLIEQHQDLANSNTCGLTQKTIVVAPTWGKNATLEVCGEQLLSVLVEMDYHVVLRPHPMTIKHQRKLLKTYADKFKDRDNFTLQLDSCDVSELFQAQVLITDWSGIAMEYAFVCHRPVIFIDVPKKRNNPDDHLIEAVPVEVSIRDRIGAVVSPDNLESLPDVIKAQLEKIDNNHITPLMDECVYHVRQSASCMAEQIVKLIKDT